MNSHERVVNLSRTKCERLGAARSTFEQTLEAVQQLYASIETDRSNDPKWPMWSQLRSHMARICGLLEFAIRDITRILTSNATPTYTVFLFAADKRNFEYTVDLLRNTIDEFDKQKQWMVNQDRTAVVTLNFDSLSPVLDNVQNLLQAIMTPPARGPQSADAMTQPSGPQPAAQASSRFVIPTSLACRQSPWSPRGPPRRLASRPPPRRSLPW